MASGGTKLGFAHHSIGDGNFTEPYRRSAAGEQAFGFGIAFSTGDKQATLHADELDVLDRVG